MVRHRLVGGHNLELVASLPASVFHALRAASGHGPVERYGMTETLITLSARADRPPRPRWVGTPLAHVETRIRDIEAPTVAVGDQHGGDQRVGDPRVGDQRVGELEVRGPAVMAGYHRAAPGAEPPFTADGRFRTGDLACVDAEGNHRVVGRRSTDLINSGGYRVGTGEVEASLLSHPAVAEAAVIGVPDDDLGTALGRNAMGKVNKRALPIR